MTQPYDDQAKIDDEVERAIQQREQFDADNAVIGYEADPAAIAAQGICNFYHNSFVNEKVVEIIRAAYEPVTRQAAAAEGLAEALELIADPDYTHLPQIKSIAAYALAAYHANLPAAESETT